MRKLPAFLIGCVVFGISCAASSPCAMKHREAGRETGAGLWASRSHSESSRAGAVNIPNSGRRRRRDLIGLASLMILAGMAFGSLPGQSPKLPNPVGLPATPTAGAPGADWTQLYTAAYLERDPRRMADLTDRAEKAIGERLELLRTKRERNPSDEERSLAEALHNLRILRETHISQS